jgi:cytochrome c biogenesis protein CcdA
MSVAGTFRPAIMPLPEASAAGRARQLRWGPIAILAGVLTMVALFALGLVLIPRYRAAHPVSALQRSDADRVQIDDLYLDMTLVTPGFMKSRKLERYIERDPGSVLPILVGLNTHTGNISHMHHLQGNFFLVGPDGVRYPSLTSPIVLSEHHDAYMVLFPARDNRGNLLLDNTHGTLTVEAVGVGAARLRRFRWNLPIVDESDVLLRDRGLLSTLALLVALVSALLVVLSPCALELTLYYSAIISCTVTQSEREAAIAGDSQAAIAGRRRLFANLSSFVAGFTLLYAGSGATVGLIGQGVRRPLGEHEGIIQLIGGSLILLFAMRVVGLSELLRRFISPVLGRFSVLGRLSQPTGSPLSPIRLVLAHLRAFGMRRSAAAGGMRAFDSFCVGLGLSSSCLTCMGGAVLYPLLVYAGITSWYSGMITLGLYSLAIAVPMVFIALGFFQVRLSLAKRLGFNHVLRVVSGTMLAGIALLILSGHERIMTDLAFRTLGAVFRWFA